MGDRTQRRLAVLRLLFEGALTARQIMEHPAAKEVGIEHDQQLYRVLNVLERHGLAEAVRGANRTRPTRRYGATAAGVAILGLLSDAFAEAEGTAPSRPRGPTRLAPTVMPERVAGMAAPHEPLKELRLVLPARQIRKLYELKEKGQSIDESVQFALEQFISSHTHPSPKAGPPPGVAGAGGAPNHERATFEALEGAGKAPENAANP